jgi:hypothetical protein
MLKQNHTPNDTYSPLGDASPRLFTLSLEGSVVLTFRLRESQASLRLSVIFSLTPLTSLQSALPQNHRVTRLQSALPKLGHLIWLC